jgi:competence protein ComEA
VSGESIRERLSTLSRGELVGVVVVVAITLLGAGFWYVRSLPQPVEVRTDASAPAPGPTVTAGESAAPILVDVAGWVRRPGVYEFAGGARVIDAIEAAGGARPGAQLSALNLAAPLADGTQILVPREGAALPSPVPGSGTAASGGLVNVNTATAEELETLPGIGEVTAQAIIDHRTENGPFTSVDQLLDVTGIGDVTLENIRDLVTV